MERILSYFAPVAAGVPQNGVAGCKGQFKGWGANSVCISKDGGPVAILYRKVASDGHGHTVHGSGFLLSLKCMETQCRDFINQHPRVVASTPPPLASSGSEYGATVNQQRVTGSQQSLAGSQQSVTGSQQDAASEAKSIAAMIANFIVIPLIIAMIAYLILYKFNLVGPPPCAAPCLTRIPLENSRDSPQTIVPDDYQVVEPDARGPAEGTRETQEKKGMFQSIKDWGKKKLGRA